MPRRRKGPPAPGNQGGYGAQPAQAPTGMPYGEHQASIAAQQAVPLAVVPDVPTAPIDRQARIAQAIEMAKRLRPPQPLTGATRRPMEPITAGLSTGPGAGPEVLRTGDRTARTLRLLASITGDAAFDQLAEQALLRGR